MKKTCNDFRTRLERALASKAEARELRRLEWHGHLLGCADCRALLESEEALELLLASLPDPELPPELARRIVARLRQARENEAARAGDPLDQLLALDAPEESPADLARHVLARLEQERARRRAAVGSAERARTRTLDERLDRLLDRALAETDVPVGLSARVLARLAPRVGEPRTPARASRRTLLRLAAACLVVLGAASALWRALRSDTPPSPGAVEPETGSLVATDGSPAADTERLPASNVPDELLASLDLLESWDALEAAGVPTRDELSGLDDSDRLVFELLAEAELELGLEGLRDDIGPEGREDR